MVDVKNDDEGGATLALLCPRSEILAYARAAEHDDAVTALAGIQLADDRSNVREAFEGQGPAHSAVHSRRLRRDPRPARTRGSRSAMDTVGRDGNELSP